MEDETGHDVGGAVDDRPRGVHKAKLTDIDLGPKISIFYRPHRRAAMTPLENSLSREAAFIFCERIRSELEHHGDDDDGKIHSYIITGGQQKAYRMIFAWINNCVRSQSIEKFPDIPEPEDDPFSQTIDVVVAAERLGVPAGSLSYHLKKRLNNCARKHLMSLAQVRSLYATGSELYDLGLKDVACTSLFNAWWDHRLDASVDPEIMCELSDMRDDIRELDEDLHEACQNRETEVRRKWAEKAARKEAERAGLSTDNNNDYNQPSDAPPKVYVQGDWDNVGDATDALTPWPANTTHDSTQDTNFWNSGVDAEREQSTNQTWADEMNDPAPVPMVTAASIQW